MPVDITRIQPGIYLNIVSGRIKVDDINNTIAEMSRLAEEYNDPCYVVIGDASAVKNIPFDIRTLRRLAEQDRRIAGFLIVQAPYLAQMAANIITKVSPVILETYETLDEALQRAQALVSMKNMNKSN